VTEEPQIPRVVSNEDGFTIDPQHFLNMESNKEPMADRFERIHEHLSLVDETLDSMADDIEGIIDEAVQDSSIEVQYDLDEGAFETGLPVDEVTARVTRRLDPPFYVKIEDDTKLVVCDIRNEYDLEVDALDVDAMDQKEMVSNVKRLIAEMETRFESGVPQEHVLGLLRYAGMTEEKAGHRLDKLKQNGEIYEPSTDRLRTT
jgi:hypothetical protein